MMTNLEIEAEEGPPQMRMRDNLLPDMAGRFSWQTESDHRHLAMRLPCGHVANLPVAGPKAWRWDGNEDTPTLTPSIQCMSKSVNQQPAPCWHGYITAGELRPC
jgi:hypothetical protein